MNTSMSTFMKNTYYSIYKLKIKVMESEPTETNFHLHNVPEGMPISSGVVTSAKQNELNDSSDLVKSQR